MSEFEPESEVESSSTTGWGDGPSMFFPLWRVMPLAINVGGFWEEDGCTWMVGMDQ